MQNEMVIFFLFCIFSCVIDVLDCSCFSLWKVNHQFSQTGLEHCWETLWFCREQQNLITYLHPSSSKLEMFEKLGLHLAIFVTFLGNREEVLPNLLIAYYQAEIISLQPFSQFQMVAFCRCWVSIHSARQVNLPFTGLSLTWSLHLFPKCLLPSFPLCVPKTSAW